MKTRLLFIFFACLVQMGSFAFASELQWQHEIITIEREALTLQLLPALGGRILDLEFGGTGLFYTNTDEMSRAVIPHENHSLCDLFEAKRAMPYPTYGGDKTYVAPQDRWSEGKPPLDLDAGPYSFLQTGPFTFEMKSRPDRETKVQIRRTIQLLERNQVVVKDCATNIDTESQPWGVWNVTQILRPARVYVYSALAKANGHFRPYSIFESEMLFPHRVQPSDAEGYLQIDVSSDGGFKFGGINQTRSSTGRKRGLSEIFSIQPLQGRSLIWLRSFLTNPAASFAHESSVEIYNFPDNQRPYYEVEVHSPMSRLAPGQTACLKQLWSFFEMPQDSSPGQIVKKMRAGDKNVLRILSDPSF